MSPCCKAGDGEVQGTHTTNINGVDYLVYKTHDRLHVFGTVYHLYLGAMLLPQLGNGLANCWAKSRRRESIPAILRAGSSRLASTTLRHCITCI